MLIYRAYNAIQAFMLIPPSKAPIRRLSNDLHQETMLRYLFSLKHKLKDAEEWDALGAAIPKIIYTSLCDTTQYNPILDATIYTMDGPVYLQLPSKAMGHTCTSEMAK